MKHWITIVRARMITQKLRNIQWTNIHQIEDSLRAIHHRQLLLQKHTSIPSSSIQRAQHQHRWSLRRTTRNSRHFFDRRNLFGSGQQFLGWRRKNSSTLFEGFFRACANHIDLLPTWLIGNVRARALNRRAYVHAHLCMRARTHRLSRIYIYIITQYIFICIYIYVKEKNVLCKMSLPSKKQATHQIFCAKSQQPSSKNWRVHF